MELHVFYIDAEGFLAERDGGFNEGNVRCFPCIQWDLERVAGDIFIKYIGVCPDNVIDSEQANYQRCYYSYPDIKFVF
jgi:hypothetical protein